MVNEYGEWEHRFTVGDRVWTVWGDPCTIIDCIRIWMGDYVVVRDGREGYGAIDIFAEHELAFEWEFEYAG